jgi:hypothetical protein
MRPAPHPAREQAAPRFLSATKWTYSISSIVKTGENEQAFRRESYTQTAVRIAVIRNMFQALTEAAYRELARLCARRPRPAADDAGQRRTVHVDG